MNEVTQQTDCYLLLQRSTAWIEIRFCGENVLKCSTAGQYSLMLLRLGRKGDEKYLNHSISRPDTNKRAPEPAIFKTLTGTRYMRRTQYNTLTLFLDDLLRCKHRFCDLFTHLYSKTNVKIEPRRKKHYYPNYFPSRSTTNDTFLSYG